MQICRVFEHVGWILVNIFPLFFNAVSQILNIYKEHDGYQDVILESESTHHIRIILHVIRDPLKQL